MHRRSNAVSVLRRVQLVNQGLSVGIPLLLFLAFGWNAAGVVAIVFLGALGGNHWRSRRNAAALTFLALIAFGLVRDFRFSWFGWVVLVVGLVVHGLAAFGLSMSRYRRARGFDRAVGAAAGLRIGTSEMDDGIVTAAQRALGLFDPAAGAFRGVLPDDCVARAKAALDACTPNRDSGTLVRNAVAALEDVLIELDDALTMVDQVSDELDRGVIDSVLAERMESIRAGIDRQGIVLARDRLQDARDALASGEWR